MKLLTLFIFSLLSLGGTKLIQKASKEHVAVLKKIDAKYVNTKGLVMDIVKTDTLAVLEREKSFDGTLWLKRGKLKLKVQSRDIAKDESIVLIDGKTLWLVSMPPKKFKDEKPQVIKKRLSQGELEKQGLLSILNRGGILKHFDVYGVHIKNEDWTYYLTAKKKDLGLKKVSVTVNKATQVITSLKYKDNSDNLTQFDFTKTDFDKNLDEKLFSFRPPKGAKVVNY